jgi:putative ABC transport system permease protein
VSTLIQDVKYAARVLRRKPGFSLVAILTLGLGIGANTAIFSVVHAVVFQPLPYEAPDRLVRLYTQFPNMKLSKFAFSGPEFVELEETASSYEAIGGWVNGQSSLVGGAEPVRVQVSITTGKTLSLLGAPPALGRFYDEEATRPGAPDVGLISDGLWRRAFGADPAILGKVVRVDGVPTEIIGVMPRGFDFPNRTIEVWLPLTLDRASPGSRGGHFLSIVGRLRPGIDIGRARAEMDTVMAKSLERFKQRHPLSPPNHPVILEPLQQDIVGEARSPMLMLLGAVGFVLLIACANVASLFLARAEARQREVAVRRAMGAGRWRLMRQFVTEAVLLGLCGGALGLGLGWWGLGLILALDVDSIPRVQEIRVDAWVLAFTFGVSVLTGVVFGVAPALADRSGDVLASLKAAGRRTTGGPQGRQYRGVLVIGEVALAVVLVLGAGLLLRSFWRLLGVEPGFNPSGLVTMNLSLAQAVYPQPTQVVAFYRSLRDRVAELPGVESTALMTGLPPNRPINANDIEFEGMTKQPDGPIWNVDYWQIVADRYFETMQIPLVEGRYFTEGDGEGATPVAIVNKAMAEKFWPGQSPIGRRVRATPGPNSKWLTVVGIVGDVKQQGLDAAVGTELYMPMRQMPESNGFMPRAMQIAVRSASADPLALVPSIRKAIADLDPTLPVAGVRTMDEVFQRSVSRPRFLLTLLVAFALVALALAAVGIYGVLSYSVAQRTNEIGVRMALGASRSDVLRMVVRQGMRLALAGVVVGGVAAFGAAQLLRSLLFGVSPADPATFIAVAIILGFAAFAACAIPAQRATRVDPTTALRYE